jgi:NFACT protein RNA binding domain
LRLPPFVVLVLVAWLFHVDDLSSAHVYLRMKPNMTLDDISEDLLLDCASMVKANSIAGCKVSSHTNPISAMRNAVSATSPFDAA